MAEILLHWHCDGVTYSVKRLSADTCFLLAVGRDQSVRRGRRPLARDVVDGWAALPVPERCVLATEELGQPGRARSPEREQQAGA